ncbi:MAG: pseudouridine synthase [Verrucomicrobiales bacterium]|nr:pseudouridine synthase [Verrucomicrobiales bacterium]
MKLEDLIAKRLGVGTRGARALILGGRVAVAGEIAVDHRREISRFDEVLCEGAVVQAAMKRLHLMLHKPAGILSATSDPVHRTVLDLIDHPDKDTLHLAGRLDRSSTGLVLLTNDGRWSEALSDPATKVEKVYLVGTDRPIPVEAVERFAEGFWFATEGLTTRPAHLEILEECLARVTLVEGRYHQIKRMFHRIDGIRLTSLHRVRIGPHELPGDLAAGQWRVIAGID